MCVPLATQLQEKIKYNHGKEQNREAPRETSEN